MATKKRRHSEIGASGGHPKPLRFLKVIESSRKLRLPKHFCRILEKDLRKLNNVVSLKVPDTGDVWEVTLTKCNGEFWFEKTWKDFASFYSIELGYYVVFKWEVERTRFQVMIFDKTMTEVQYPRKCIPVKIEVSDDEEYVPVKSPLSSCRLSKKKMKRSTGEKASSSKHGKAKARTDHALDRRQRAECTRIHDKSGKNLVFSESRAPQQGSGFVSKHPFFQKVIKKCVLSHGLMGLPCSFAKSIINRNCRKQIVTLVTDEGGRSWPVTLGLNLQSMSANMYAGVSNFLKENFVREGSLCTFELIDRTQMVLRVHIHRGKDEIPHYNVCSKRQCSSKMANTADMHGLKFASKYPFFQATISKDNLLRNRLTVPRAFVKDNMNTECSHDILSLETGGGQSWPVKLLTSSNPRQHAAELGGGFLAFHKENNLKEGDCCTFELINRENLVFRVSIYSDLV